MPECLYCKKETEPFKYCDKACRVKYFKAIRYAEMLKRRQRFIDFPLLCEVCHKKIENPHPSQKGCSKECQRILARRRAAKSSAKKRAAVPTEKRKCRCGQAFTCKVTSKQIQCRQRDCINHQQKLKARIRLRNYKKIAQHLKKINETPSEIRDAKCPGCGVIHQYTFEPKWIGNGMPRIGCSRWPSCTSGPAFRDGRTTEVLFHNTWEMVYESDNSARI